MKVTALFTNYAGSQGLAALLRHKCRSDELVMVDQSYEKLSIDIPEVASADLLILESPNAETLDWGVLEEFNLTYPQATSVLITDGDMERILIQAMRVGVRDVLRESEAEAQLPGVISRARARMEAIAGRNTAGKIFTFIPCKGGSGTSFITSNLAYVMGTVLKKKVMLFDLDLQFSDASFYISDDQSQRSLGDLVRKTEVDGNALEAACIMVGKHLWLLRAPQNPEQAVGITPEQIDNILTVATKRFDYIFVDLERTLDPLSLRAMDRSQYVFPIMQAVLPYVRGTQRLQRTFRALHYPDSKVRLIANRQGNKNSDLPVDKIEAALHTRIYRHLPNDFSNASVSISAGKPLYDIAPDGPLTKALIQLAQQLAESTGDHVQPQASGGQGVASVWRQFTSLLR